jgi:hypothetical protein
MRLVLRCSNNGEKTIALGPISNFNLVGTLTRHRFRCFLNENAAVLKVFIYGPIIRLSLKMCVYL